MVMPFNAAANTKNFLIIKVQILRQCTMHNTPISLLNKSVRTIQFMSNAAYCIFVLNVIAPCCLKQFSKNSSI